MLVSEGPGDSPQGGGEPKTELRVYRGKNCPLTEVRSVAVAKRREQTGRDRALPLPSVHSQCPWGQSLVTTQLCQG